MPRSTTLVLGFITAILCGSLFAANTQPTAQSINKIPLSFTKNMGQWDDRVLFRANAGGATMWFTKAGVTYQYTRRVSSPPSPLPMGEGWSQTGVRERAAASLDSRLRGNDKGSGDRMERDSVEQLVLTAKFVGANPNPEIIAEGQMEYKCNYFLGNDPETWYTDVPNYEAITLKDLYPGIDLKYSGDGNDQAAYEFIVALGADIAQIKVAYEGAEETSLDDNGRLMLKTKWGDMIAALGSDVNSTGLASPRFALNSKNTLGVVADGQSLAQASSWTLTLSYSTYLGGGNSDYAGGIALDGGGNAYVTGVTFSTNFPTQNPYQTFQDVYDVFVTKLSSSGNTLIYSTYLGGGVGDAGLGIAVDGSGNACVTGYTLSSNFPTQNPYQTDQSGEDVFVAKLSSTGNSLIYSTYLGGEDQDVGEAIAVDGVGNAYVTGVTGSSSFPTVNPYQATFQGGYRDAFVTKLSSSGSSLIYSTYLGGEDGDYGFGIAVDGSGNAYVTGWTVSSNFPTQDPYQTYQSTAGYSDVFVTKVGSLGNSLIYSTFLGGAGSDHGYAIAVDGSDNAYVTGWTVSSDFPTQNPYQSFQGGLDVFVTKLSYSGNSLIYSTYLGGGNQDEGKAIVVDGSGNAYVTGRTGSSNFPTKDPYQTYQGLVGYSDIFVTKFSSSGNSLIYSTYLGGGSHDESSGIAADGSGNAYVTGLTHSSDFPTQDPYQTYQGLVGYGDAFVTKLTRTPVCPRGDVNSNGRIDLRDLVFLRNYVLLDGTAPQWPASADVNCSGSSNIDDVVLLINYIFRGGPAPCSECE